MRGRGKPGYVAKIVDRQKQFLNPKTYSVHGTSAKQLTYEFKEDGIYEVCDANFGGRRRNISFIKLENGETVAESEVLAELLVTEELPELEGSVKQVDWATNIRQSYLAKIKQLNKPTPEWVQTTSSAKWWIDNRGQLQ